MHLLVVTGFLGSGKTSLIVRLAEAARRREIAVAIIVNEIGDIGIDDQPLRRLDHNVWELTNGCICCTLSGDLVDTLHALDERDDVDLVIVEASGAADPKSLLAALPYYRGRALGSVRSVAVLDPFRLPMLLEVMTLFVEGGIGLADAVVVAKSDLATEDGFSPLWRRPKESTPRRDLEPGPHPAPPSPPWSEERFRSVRRTA